MVLVLSCNYTIIYVVQILNGRNSFSRPELTSNTTSGTNTSMDILVAQRLSFWLTMWTVTYSAVAYFKGVAWEWCEWYFDGRGWQGSLYCFTSSSWMVVTHNEGVAALAYQFCVCVCLWLSVFVCLKYIYAIGLVATQLERLQANRAVQNIPWSTLHRAAPTQSVQSLNKPDQLSSKLA